MLHTVKGGMRSLGRDVIFLTLLGGKGSFG